MEQSKFFPKGKTQTTSPILSPTTKPYSSNCHTGNVLAFEHQNVQVYGGGSSRAVKPNEVDVILDLTHKYQSWGMPQGWKSAKFASSIVVCDMSIVDMQAPHVGKPFWEALWFDLTKLAKGKPKPLKVLAVCVGGHGRTGTVLTALACASGVLPLGADDPVKWLREHYCDEAVETASQNSYIEDTFNCVVGVKPAKAYGASGYTAPTTSPYYDATKPKALQPYKTAYDALGKPWPAPSTTSAKEHKEDKGKNAYLFGIDSAFGDDIY